MFIRKYTYDALKTSYDVLQRIQREQYHELLVLRRQNNLLRVNLHTSEYELRQAQAQLRGAERSYLDD